MTNINHKQFTINHLRVHYSIIYIYNTTIESYKNILLPGQHVRRLQSFSYAAMYSTGLNIALSLLLKSHEMPRLFICIRRTLGMWEERPLIVKEEDRGKNSISLNYINCVA